MRYTHKPRLNRSYGFKDGYVATIMDVEVDPVKCNFGGDGTVIIKCPCDCSGYVMLDQFNLNQLGDLIQRADSKFMDGDYEGELD